MLLLRSCDNDWQRIQTILSHIPGEDPEYINLISLASDDLASQGIQYDLLNINEIPYRIQIKHVRS